MKRNIFIILIPLIYLASAPLFAQVLPQRCPLLTSMPTKTPPDIDGKLEDLCWQAAATVENFTLLDSTTLATEKTEAYVTYDENNLYFAFKCFESQIEEIKKEATTYDSPQVWQDDCIEIFIDPNLSFKTYFHFVVNALGTRYDEKCLDASWNAPWEAKASIDKDSWTCEVAIPFNTLGITPKAGSIFGLNLCRSEIRLKEQSAWSPTTGGFHNPSRFGNLILGVELDKEGKAKVPISAQLESLGDLVPGGYNALRGTVINQSKEPIDLEIKVEVVPAFNPDKRSTNYQGGTLNAGESVGGEIYYTVREAGDHNLLIIGSETKKGQLLYFGNFYFQVPALLVGEFGYRLKENDNYILWWAEGTYKISRERRPPYIGRDYVEIYAARNEYEPFQLVIHPRIDLKNVKIKVSEFKTSKGKSLKSFLQPSDSQAFGLSDIIDINLVEYVPVVIPTDSFGSPGDYPDPLPPYQKPFDCPANKNQPIWVTVYVPEKAPADIYRGSITITPENAPAMTVPVQLKVWNFTLPKETHTKTAYGVHLDADFHGIKKPEDMDKTFDLYLQNCARHRISPYSPMAYHPIKQNIEGPKLLIDNGLLKLTCDQFKGDFFSISYGKTELGRITSCLTQFEREGIGWQGTGIGWPSTNRIKKWEIKTKEPDRCIVDIVAEKTTSGEASRKYEIAQRFTIYANQPWLKSQLLYLKNTDTVEWRLDGYFHLIPPVNPQEAEGYNSQGYGAWLSQRGALGGLELVPGSFSFSLRDGHGDIHKSVGLKLAPGEVYETPQPEVIIFANNIGTKESVDKQVKDLKEKLLQPFQPTPSLVKIRYEERKEPKIDLDFADFDKAAQRYLDGFKFNAFNFGGIPGDIAGYPQFSEEFNELFAKIYGRICEHWKTKGWLSKAYCYWYDEPEESAYPYVIKGMKLLKQACPGLKRLLTEQPEPPLYGFVDIWVPVLSMYNEERAKERQKAGDWVWWYVCCGPRAPYPNNFIDHPAINHRIRFWMMQKYGVQGSLYWSANYYWGKGGERRNPWKTAMSISPDGGLWGNGDGMLLYPPVREPSKEPIIAGPINSIRWELLREGLEDREYFWLLEQGIKKLEKKKDPKAQRLLKQAREALKLPDSLCRSLIDYEKDPQKLYQARETIAQIIERIR